MASHVEVAGLGDGEDVWRELSEFPAVVQPHLEGGNNRGCLYEYITALLH